MKRVVSNGAKLFSGVDQGSGNTIAMRWFWLHQVKRARFKFGLMKNMEKTFKFYGESKYETSASTKT